MSENKDKVCEAKTENILENCVTVAKKVGATIDKPVEKYGNAVAKNLGYIIKAISFVVAFSIIILTFVIAFLVFSTQPLYIAISFGIVVVGVIIAAISMFLIYGLGHLIIQNNEILKRLKDLNK